MKTNTSLATSNNAKAITAEGASTLVTNIKDGLKLVSQGYLSITPDVAKLYDCKGYKPLGYQNFDELCANEFGMSHGTTVGIRKVFERFGSVSADNTYTIPEKYLEYGYTKLLLFTDKKFEQVGIDPIEAFTPDMTIAEMKSELKLKLDAKAEEQDAGAVDTTATDVTSTDTTATDVTSTDTTATDATSTNPKTLIQEAMDTILAVQGMVELKPEKMALFDAVIANLKEIKKLVK